MEKRWKASFPGAKIVRFEKVGPVVGSELRREAVIALCIALVGILLYITVRFQFRFAVVSVLALLHDAIITLGAFSLSGMEVSSTFIAAILTIVGYSLNDTIVVLDRIRENWKNVSTGILEVLNESVNETLSRTINTSLTTLLPRICAFLYGRPRGSTLLLRHAGRHCSRNVQFHLHRRGSFGGMVDPLPQKV